MGQEVKVLTPQFLSVIVMDCILDCRDAEEGNNVNSPEFPLCLTENKSLKALRLIDTDFGSWKMAIAS